MKNIYINLATSERNEQVIDPNKPNNILLGKLSGYTNNKLVAKNNSTFTTVIGDLYYDNNKIHDGNLIDFCKFLNTSINNIGEHISSHISGHFLVIHYDSKLDMLIAFNDKMGSIPLYYNTRNKCMELSSSIQPIKENGNTSHNLQAIYEYLYFHMIPSPNTIYNEIKKIKPASILVWQKSGLEINDYWIPTFNESTIKSLDTLSHELHDSLSKSVKNSINSYSRPGAFLSGGLDSSTVTGYLKSHANHGQAFTIGFDAKGYDETPYARMAAKHFDIKHFIYYVTPSDVTDILPKIIDSLDEPFGNSSIIPSYFCAALAKEHDIDILLAGDGGDELFAGNERYAKQAIFEKYQSLPAILRKTLLDPLGKEGLPFSTTFPISKISSYIKQAKIKLPDRLQTYNFLHQNDPKDIFCDSFLSEINTDFPLIELREQYNKIDAEEALSRMLYLDWKFTLGDNDLRKVSSVCKMLNINVAYPMLEDSIVNLACNVPSKIKLKNNKLRYFYKYAMKDFLPSEIINKSKHGFGLPFGAWLRTYAPLQELAFDSLSSLKNRNIIKSTFIDYAIHQHKTGHAAYYGELIWVLMILELFLSRN